MFFSKRRIALFAPLAAFLMLIAVAVVVLIGRVTPLVAAERALVNLGGDMAQRLEGSPFGAFPMLIEALEDGVVNISFDYSDRWSSGSFDIEFHSDEANRVYKMIVDFDVDGFGFDLEIHMDRHRIAASSSLLGDEFFGLTYETFRQDFRPFGRMLGLSDSEIDEIADIIEMIGDILDMPDPGMEIYEPYIALLRQFILDGTMSSESTTIESRGQEVNVTRAMFRFTDDEMIGLLRDLMVTMSMDQNMDPLGMIEPWMWEELFSELDFALNELEGFDGEMFLAMDIGPGNRLISLSCFVTFQGQGSNLNLYFSADFGNSVFDPWYFTLAGIAETPNWNDATQTDTNIFEIEFVWTYTETAGRFVNTIEISWNTENSWWNSWDEAMEVWSISESGRLISDWNSNTGGFVLAFESDGPWGERFEVSGIYRLDSNGGFFFSLGPIDTGRETFSLEVSTRLGANINPPQSFINFSDIQLGTFLDLLMQF